MRNDFVHLHIHSHYSLLDGLPKIDALIEKAKKLKMDALAITDHGAMHGVIEFYQKARAAGIKPIIGVETYVAKEGIALKRTKIDDRPNHLILLAKDNEGYQNLINLVTISFLEGFYYKPRVDDEVLAKYSKGIIALSACIHGSIPEDIIKGKLDEAVKKALFYNKIFGEGNFYLELQHHPNIPEQKIVNEGLIKISEKYGIGLVATNDVHYLDKDDSEAQEILLCVQTGNTLDDKNRLSFRGTDLSFRSQEEMAKVFKDIPEAILNTAKIKERCNVEIGLGKTELPHFEVPEGETPDTFLKKLCFRGLQARFPKEKITPEIIERLNFELSVIEKTGFASYFLIVQDFVNFAKNNKIVVGPGRGSAAGSIVSYLLNITNVDPIRYGLLFERFLNPERISMPDIDLDFTDVRRNEVLEYISEKYGHDHVAQIITFGTMAARAAIRDTGRAMGLPYSFCDKIAKMVPFGMSLEKALSANFDLRKMYESDAETCKLIDMAKKLEGVARHASTHACGVVITKNKLNKYVPRQYASQDDKTIVTQYSLHPIEDLGLLKIDLLGLKNLTIIENALKIIEKTGNIKIDISNIPLDDKKTFELFRKAETTGVFQLESSGMRRYLRELRPTNLEDIIAMIALYRPGPMKLIPEYIAGKRGLKKPTYLHPILEPILNKTHGIAVYQEQVLQIARDLAGFTLGEADVLRKAVGKKIASLLNEQREKFVQGAIKNGIDKRIAEKVFSFIEPFASYGFNKAHATCYAVIAYQTAYLKANFPAEFMASLLTADQGDIDRIAIEVNECEKMGIPVLPPDVNESFQDFTTIEADGPSADSKNSLRARLGAGPAPLASLGCGVNKKAIRFGLNAVKNVGADVTKAIIEERKKNGHFKTLEDFLERIQTKESPRPPMVLNKKSLESLAKCGALDSLEERNRILKNTEEILTFNKSFSRKKSAFQKDLFADKGISSVPKLRLENTLEATREQKLSWEKELLGLYVTEHPLSEYEDFLADKTTPLVNINISKSNEMVTVAGVINKIKKIITRSNKPMLFVQIEDQSGSIETLVFPNILEKNYEVFQEEKKIIITGRVSDKDGTPKILCDNVKELPSLVALNAEMEKINRITIPVPETLKKDTLMKLKEILEKNPGGTEVFLRIPEKEKKIKTSLKVKMTPLLRKEISGLLGCRITID